MRIGVVSDTHIPEAGPELPPQLFDAFQDSDLILHCGDTHAISVVDRLEQLAPTLAARGNGDTYEPSGLRPGVPEDARVAHVRVIEIEGFRVGLIHDLELAEKLPDESAQDLMTEAFGAPVDIALCGHTHVPSVRTLAGGAAILNPGSATMPYGYTHLLGTVARLEIRRDRFEFTVLDLPSGRVEITYEGPGVATRWRGPRPAPR